MIKQTLVLFTLAFVLSGCASLGKQWKEFISGKTPAEKTVNRPQSTTFSQANNLSPSQYRQYKRVKRKDIEDGAHLDSKAGSLWVMEGQGAYLFSQNIVRMIGDPLAVRIEGDPQDQLSSKAKVISKLLTQIEERRRKAQGRGLASEEKKDGEKTATAGAPGANPTPPPVAPPVAQNVAASADDSKEFNVKMVPTRVVERLVDGNYRVRGTQPFMIGQREYKVIVSGIVRAEDFSDAGLAAPQLLDASFDIVSSKSTEIR